MGDMTKNFSKHELDCKCGCGRNLVTQEFAKKLQTARDIACLMSGNEILFKINSGTRCAKHNAEVGGKPDSAHISGHAVDIACTNSSARYYIFLGLNAAGFCRFEMRKEWIHVDDDPDKPINLIFFE